MKLPLQLFKSPSGNESSSPGRTQGDSSAFRVKVEVLLQDKVKDQLLPTVSLLVFFGFESYSHRTKDISRLVYWA